MSKYIVDTSVLIDFYCVREKPDSLLKACGGEFNVAEKVNNELFGNCRANLEWESGWREFEKDVKKGRIRVLEVGGPEIHELRELDKHTPMSDRGELDSATLAITHGFVLLMNDSNARRDLLGSGIKILGSDWVTKASKFNRKRR